MWRKGGTQKIDGSWALLRKEVSRRSVTNEQATILPEMVFVHQFLYWRSSDPIRDAWAGKRESPQPRNHFEAFCAVTKRRDATLRLWEGLEVEDSDRQPCPAERERVDESGDEAEEAPEPDAAEEALRVSEVQEPEVSAVHWEDTDYEPSEGE